MKVQELIENSPADKEEQRFADIRVRIPVFGHEKQVWKAVLTLMRHAALAMGNKLEFYAGGELLEDSMEDDDAENWHSLDPSEIPPPLPHKRGRTDNGPPYPEVWKGDTHAGHAPWCAVRVKNHCGCGYEEWLQKAAREQQKPGTVQQQTGPWMGAGIEIRYDYAKEGNK